MIWEIIFVQAKHYDLVIIALLIFFSILNPKLKLVKNDNSKFNTEFYDNIFLKLIETDRRKTVHLMTYLNRNAFSYEYYVDVLNIFPEYSYIAHELGDILYSPPHL